MYTKRIFAPLIIIMALAAITARVNAQSSDPPADPPSILGTWEVTTTFPDGFRSKSIETFAPGQAIDLGSVFSTADIDFTFPIPCANQQGVWKSSSVHDFHTTFEGFCYDGNAPFAPFGKLKIQQKITLGRLGKGFVGKALVTITKNDGTVDFTSDATMRAVRMEVEPLP